MKRLFKDNIIWYISVFLVWLLPGLKKDVHFESMIFISAFIITLLSLCFIKNKPLVLVTVAVITVSAAVYDYSYLFHVVPPLLLIIMAESKEKQIFETCNTVFITTMIFKSFYFIYLFVSANMIVSSFLIDYIKASFLIMLSFSVLLVSSFKTNSNRKGQSIKKSKIIYSYALTSIIFENVLLVIRSSSGAVQSAQFDFVYYFVLLLIIIYNDDAAVRYIYDKIREKTEKVIV